MVDGGPYRHAASENCPVCSTRLPMTDPAQPEPRACANRCGDWCGVEAVRRRWGGEADEPGGLLLVGPTRLEKTTQKLPCAICGQILGHVIHREWTAYRCRDHGVWFNKDSRQRYERTLSREIKLYLSVQDEASKLAEVITNAVARDADAARTLALRIVKLELKLAQQVQELQSLERRVG